MDAYTGLGVGCHWHPSEQAVPDDIALEYYARHIGYISVQFGLVRAEIAIVLSCQRGTNAIAPSCAWLSCTPLCTDILHSPTEHCHLLGHQLRTGVVTFATVRHE